MKNITDSKKEEQTDHSLFNNNFDMNIYWLERELEFQNQRGKHQFRVNQKNPAQFGKIINALFGIRKEELGVLSVDDGNFKTIQDKEEIWNYDFLNHCKKLKGHDYRSNEGGCCKLANQVVLTLSYRTYESGFEDKDKSLSKKEAILIIHLQHPYGSIDHAAYIQVTFCQPIIWLERSKKGFLPQTQNLTLLMAYDYRKVDENIKELNKLLYSAEQKISKEQYDDLTNLEYELISVMEPRDVEKDFTCGKFAMKDSRFWDAILYFENALNSLLEKIWKEKLTDKESDILYESSSCIGSCYYEIGLFDKAYKYLEFSARGNEKKYKYQCEYISCLIKLHDIRVLNVIDHQLEKMEGIPQAERTSQNQEFIIFLLKRKAYCLFKCGQSEQSKIYLKQILEIDPRDEFARHQIKNIRIWKRE